MPGRGKAFIPLVRSEPAEGKAFPVCAFGLATSKLSRQTKVKAVRDKTQIKTRK